MISKIRALIRKFERRLHDARGLRSYGRWVSSRVITHYRQQGRGVVAEIHPWAPAELRASALVDYGVPEHIADLLDVPFGSEVTIADFLVGAMVQLRRPGRFLEVGTGIGKTIFQVMKVVAEGHFTTIDIEALNPALLAHLERTGDQQEWETPAGSVLPYPSSLTNFAVNGTAATFTFARADMFDPSLYQKLGEPYDVFFFDAMKTGASTAQTLENILAANLIGNKFMMLWNDASDEMQDSLDAFARKLSKQGRGRVQSRIVYLHGWIGAQEYRHLVGVLTNWPRPPR